MNISQSFDILNRYGKDTTALASITRAFIEDLQPYTEEQIIIAFKLWRRSNDSMPTPSNIINVIREDKKESIDDQNRVMQFSEYKQRVKSCWQSYKGYLYEKNELSPRLDPNVSGVSGGSKWN